MPKQNVDYSKTIIYKIVCNDLSIKDIYVGSTTNFKNRKNNHKTKCINSNQKEYDFKVYKFIRENGGWDNWTMIEIEKYPCNDKNECRSRERYHIEILNATLNEKIPSRTVKQYYEDNKETILQYHKEYDKKNKEKINKYQRQYKDINKEKIKNVNNQYRLKHKHHLNEKFNCVCGGKYIRKCISQHEKTKRHKNYMNSQQK